MGLYKTDREIYPVRYGVEKTERNIEKFNFFVGRERKGQAAFRRLFFCAVPRRSGNP